MIHVQKIDLKHNNKEEIIPEFPEDFPYIASCAELGKYINSDTPWHWHNTVEIFYMEKGSIEYITPRGSFYFPEGSCGFVNLGTLHSTYWDNAASDTIQLLHLFHPEFLSGKKNSRIEKKYIRPLTDDSGIEIIPIYPNCDSNIKLINMIRSAFSLSEEDLGYEFKIRQAMCNIWMQILSLETQIPEHLRSHTGFEIKMMMTYIHEHYSEHISVEEIAAYAHVSKRGCFRIFQEQLHMTPLDYIKSYRLKIAVQLLIESQYSITEIASMAGFGSSSYFSKIFKTEKGCTPSAFQRNWHDCYKIKHK